MSETPEEVLISVAIWIACWIFCGIVAAKVGGEGNGGLCFFLGILFGPLGVIVAAIIGHRAGAQHHTVDVNLRTSAVESFGVAPPRRRIVVHRRSRGVDVLPPAREPAAVAIQAPRPLPRVTCPHCQRPLDAEGMFPGGTYACPLCGGVFSGS